MVDAAFGLAEEPPAVGEGFVVNPVFEAAGLDGAEEFGAEGGFVLGSEFAAFDAVAAEFSVQPID